jgi:hypothetical protein
LEDEMHTTPDEMQCTADFPVDADAFLAHGIAP